MNDVFGIVLLGFIMVVWITICIMISKMRVKPRDLSSYRWCFGCACKRHSGDIEFQHFEADTESYYPTSRDLDLLKDSVLTLYNEYVDCVVISAIKLEDSNGCYTSR